jgi:prepilin-type processing-associated H-X9-DG protein
VHLPFDWRDWTPIERRAVLAHELAHVCRGDFLAGLVAHLSLALNFYHPLAHWLAFRLRLEQELAADAWGARLAGGKQTYLTTLAEMALKRDSRTLTWPARAFLPSRNTFLRRINMLRNTSTIRHRSMPIAFRVLTLGALGAAGLLIAGFRGPASGAASQDEPQPKTSARASGAAVQSAAITPEPFDLAYLPDDAKMLLALQPSGLLARPELRQLWDAIRHVEPFLRGSEKLPPEQIKQVLIFWEGTPPAAAGPGALGLIPPPSGLVLHMASAQDWKRLTAPSGGADQEIRFEGQSYHRPSGARSETWCGFTPDDRTLVLAQEDLLRELISGRGAPPQRFPWSECWKRVVKGHVMLGLETRWLKRRVSQVFQIGPAERRTAFGGSLPFDTISPLFEKTQSYALAIDGTADLALDLVAAAHSEQSAKPVADTFQALLTLARNASQAPDGNLPALPPAVRAAAEWSAQAASAILDKARVEISGSFVRVGARFPLDLAEGSRRLAPAIQTASTAAIRTQSVNHLKQIGLAFHNYHDVHGRFPTPVLHGGRDGKIPYSWRIAILPFLDQQDLYNQYQFDEPWDSPANLKVLEKMPAVYSYSGAAFEPANHNAAYFVFTGSEPALAERVQGASRVGPNIAAITDGTSNTILAVEAKREIPWTKPEDIPFDSRVWMPEIGSFTPDGLNALFADGSVRFIPTATNERVLRALITRDGGEVISPYAF